MYSIQQCKKDIALCEREIAHAASVLAKVPAGSLYHLKRKNKTYWYHKANSASKSVLIKKENMDFARLLAAKSCCRQQLNYYQMLHKSLSAFAKNYKENMISYRKYIASHPETAALAAPYLSAIQEDIQQKIADWISEDYEKSQKYPAFLKFKSLKGDLVRSKSECMIADALMTKGIPYRYECRNIFYMNGDYHSLVIYPDFTIMHPGTGELFIWEHFGLSDDMDYLLKCIQKIQVYIANGFIPMKNLILTFETREQPLDSSTIYSIISQYFTA